jgi:hypothetical protein
MTLDEVVMSVAGCAAIGAGAGAILFRDRLASHNRRNIEERFGTTFPAARRSTPGMMAWLGTLWIVIGVSIVTRAVFP